FHFCFDDTRPPAIYTLSLHDALPISLVTALVCGVATGVLPAVAAGGPTVTAVKPAAGPTSGGTVVTVTGTNLTGARSVTFGGARSEEHTSELQSQSNLVCRLLLEKKK